MSKSLYFALRFSTISSKSSQLIFGSLQKHADSCNQIAIELTLLSFVLAMHVGIIFKQDDSLFTGKQTCVCISQAVLGRLKAVLIHQTFLETLST